MKKSLLALATFVATTFSTAVSAQEQSVTTTFEGLNTAYITASNVNTILGDDWGYSGSYNYAYRVQPDLGPDGSYALKTGTTVANGEKAALVYYAKGPGSISMDILAYGYQADQDAFVEFFSVNYDGSTFTLGSSIGKFTGLSTSEWSNRSIEISETGWIAFKSGRTYIDNFTNTWTGAAASETYTLSGIVTNSETSAPVADAKVSVVGGGSTVTDADGAFSFADMAEGDYMVSVSADGYVASQTNVTVAGADVADLKIALDPQKSILKGSVISSLSDASPVKDAVLNLYVAGTEESVATFTTGEDGAYELTITGILNAGGYSLSMSAPFYQSVTRTISVGGVAPCFRQGETVQSNLYLNPKYVGFYANVMDADSVGITNATVLLMPEGAEEPVRAVNYGGGRYGVSNISAATVAPSYTFTVNAPYYESFTSEAFTLDGKDYDTDVVLASQTYTFTAKVTNRFGGAIEGATLSIDGKSCEADVDGLFTWTISAVEAADDSFEAEATAPGYDTQKYEFNFKESNDVTYTFLLSELKYTLLVNVTDDEGYALAAAEVTVKDATGGQLNVSSGGNGSFTATVTALAAAKTTYEVTATCEGYVASEPKTVSLADGDVEITIALEAEPVSLDAINADSAAEAIFDLSGRRVNKAAKGTVTISNGKKTLNL